MSDQIIINGHGLELTTKPATLEVNFEELEKALKEHLKTFEVVVTEDGLKDAKALATELNAIKKAINARRIAATKDAMAPIDAFADQMKTLSTMVEDGRQNLLTQVEKFESGRVEQARELLIEHRAELYELYKIRPEYQMAEVEDFAKVSALTGKGKLNKAARDKVSAAVEVCRTRQQMVDLRLSQLENASHRAGLHAPLTREHIAGILEADEERYQVELQALLERELERQRITEEKTRAQAQPEVVEMRDPEPDLLDAPPAATLTEDGPVDEAEYQAAAAEYLEGENSPAPEPQIIPPANPAGVPGKVSKVVTATFEINVSPSITDEAIEAELRRKMAAGGISTLQAISIVEKFDF